MEGDARHPDSGTAMRFDGKASDYFSIWIVNVLLTAITLGVWSAWAKVRRQRYFLGNTQVLGGSLDYLASPVTILVGRILVVLALLAYAAAQAFFPPISIVLALAFMVALPWIVCRALRFNARNTIWRNVRFDFDGTWKSAAFAFLLIPFVSQVLPMAALVGIMVLVFFTLLGGSLATSLALMAVLPIVVVIGGFALYPFTARAMAKFWVNNHLLGTARFQMASSLSQFYGALGRTALVALGFGVVWGLVAYGITRGLPSMGSEMAGNLEVLPLLIAILALPFVWVVTTYFRAEIRNIVLRGLALEGGHRFRTSISPLRYTWIQLSNLVVTLITIGLAHPWAAVRSWRYTTTNIQVVPGSDVQAFADSQASAGGAFGSEFVALDSISVGF
jgi:uncharacterized membrane protein YjgN (DUF898 family)